LPLENQKPNQKINQNNQNKIKRKSKNGLKNQNGAVVIRHGKTVGTALKRGYKNVERRS
jgi:hypothetical protein